MQEVTITMTLRVSDDADLISWTAIGAGDARSSGASSSNFTPGEELLAWHERVWTANELATSP